MLDNKIKNQEEVSHVILKTHFLMIQVYIQKLVSDVSQQEKID